MEHVLSQNKINPRGKRDLYSKENSITIGWYYLSHYDQRCRTFGTERNQFCFFSPMRSEKATSTLRFLHIGFVVINGVDLMDIEDIEREITSEEFDHLVTIGENGNMSTWLTLGKSLPLIEFKFKKQMIDWSKVVRSKVWLHSEYKKNGNVIFTADSDAIITKELWRWMVRVSSDHTPDEIVKLRLISHW